MDDLIGLFFPDLLMGFVEGLACTVFKEGPLVV